METARRLPAQLGHLRQRRPGGVGARGDARPQPRREALQPKAIHAHISNRKNDLITPEISVALLFRGDRRARLPRYQESLRANNAMDFDDLLLRTVLLLRENVNCASNISASGPICWWTNSRTPTRRSTRCCGCWQRTDEQPQPLCRGRRRPVVYRFRGADYRNVLQLSARITPTHVEILLEQNYRSTQTILDVANALISQNRNRTPKRLHTDNGQGVPVTGLRGVQRGRRSRLCLRRDREAAGQQSLFSRAISR
jgi:DNA helicase-2/ATP-dependent DNA helicase PcrA